MVGEGAAGLQYFWVVRRSGIVVHRRSPECRSGKEGLGWRIHVEPGSTCKFDRRLVVAGTGNSVFWLDRNFATACQASPRFVPAIQRCSDLPSCQNATALQSGAKNGLLVPLDMQQLLVSCWLPAA